MEAIGLLLSEEPESTVFKNSAKTDEEIDDGLAIAIELNSSNPKQGKESLQSSQTINQTVKQVVEDATNQTKDEKFKEIMQSYGRAVGDENESKLKQQAEFDMAYEQLMKGAE